MRSHDSGIQDFSLSIGTVKKQIKNFEEQKNRFLKTTQFEINNIPEEVEYDQMLTVSGNSYPKSAIILKFESVKEGLEKIRVITSD